MKNMGDMLLRKPAFQEIVRGNTALVRGMIEDGTFVQLSLFNITGGMVIILGDDPGANSSQNEQDNRHFGYMSYTPILEPANPTEAHQYYKEAAG